eukprot:5156118-Pyramimonas_sp.AAC.1
MFDTLKHIADLVEDPIFALVGEFTLDPMSSEQTRDYLRAEFYSDDTPEGLDSRAYKALTPLAVGAPGTDNPAALGCTGFWQRHSGRTDELARRIG